MYFWVNEVCLCWRIGGFGYVDELEEAVRYRWVEKFVNHFAWLGLKVLTSVDGLLSQSLLEVWMKL